MSATQETLNAVIASVGILLLDDHARLGKCEPPPLSKC